MLPCITVALFMVCLAQGMRKIDPHRHAARQGHRAVQPCLPVVTLEALQGVTWDPCEDEKAQAPRMLPCITVALFMVCLAPGHAQD
jgi:hypothetical protein